MGQGKRKKTDRDHEEIEGGNEEGAGRKPSYKIPSW